MKIGTSGWSYPHWNRLFYPPRLTDTQRLTFLARSFPTVELNGSFYRLQHPDNFRRWRAAVPPDFEFAVKASRYITHMLRLGGGAAPLGNFFAQGLLALGRQLGPILWQLPPQLAFDADRARAFFSSLPPDLAAAERIARRHDARLAGRALLTAPDEPRARPLRHALEVRHETWLSDQAYSLFIEHGIALVTADSAGRFPLSLTRTADFVYIRLHGARRLYGSRYTAAELAFWADRICEWASDGCDVYVYFDNDNKAFAPGNALDLQSRVDARLGGTRTPAAPF